MDKDEIQNDLSAIRRMMEQSSKFISLSGLSGILIGLYAIIGAVMAYSTVYPDYGLFGYRDFYIPNTAVLYQLVHIALTVLVLSLLTGFLLTWRKARKKGQRIWNLTSRKLLFYTAVPLLAGGVFTLLLLQRGYYGVIAPVMLLFYGLSLVSGSSFTYAELQYLGISEIILGLLAAYFPGYGLVFWALGFGVLHMVYGTALYLKYDR